MSRPGKAEQMQTQFTYDALPYRVVFGSCSRRSARSEYVALGVSRVLILTTPEQAELGSEFAELLGGLSAGVFSKATMHTPVQVTKEAIDVVASVGADAVLAVGGGSTIGLGKAIARVTDLPQIVVATTYAGSEMTAIVGETKGDE